MSLLLALILAGGFNPPPVRGQDEGTDNGVVRVVNCSGAGISCVNTAGVLAVTVTGSGSSSATNYSAAWCAAQCSGSGIGQPYATACTTTGAGSSASVVVGSKCYQQLGVDTTLNNPARMAVVNGGYSTNYGKFEARVLSGDYTGQRHWAAVANTFISNLLDTPSATSSYKYAGFRYAPALDTTWKCCIGSGTTDTCTDSGVTPTALTDYHLTFERGASSNTWTINGTTVCSGVGVWPTSTSYVLEIGAALTNAINGTARFSYVQSVSFTRSHD